MDTKVSELQKLSQFGLSKRFENITQYSIPDFQNTMINISEQRSVINIKEYLPNPNTDTSLYVLTGVDLIIQDLNSLNDIYIELEIHGTCIQKYNEILIGNKEFKNHIRVMPDNKYCVSLLPFFPIFFGLLNKSTVNFNINSPTCFDMCLKFMYDYESEYKNKIFNKQSNIVEPVQVDNMLIYQNDFFIQNPCQDKVLWVLTPFNFFVFSLKLRFEDYSDDLEGLEIHFCDMEKFVLKYEPKDIRKQLTDSESKYFYLIDFHTDLKKNEIKMPNNYINFGKFDKVHLKLATKSENNKLYISSTNMNLLMFADGIACCAFSCPDNK